MRNLIRIWSFISFAVIIFITAFIFVFIFYKGRNALSFDFLLGKPEGIILGKEGGIFPAIVGSLYTSMISAIISSMFGISAGIYLVFYNKNKYINSCFDIVFQCIAGIPSVVLGLFGYAMLVLYLGFGKSILSMAITQSIMILPFISIRIKKVLKELNTDIINSSYALGISKSYTIIHIVLKEIGIKALSIVMLASSLAIGAAAPLIFTGAVINAPLTTSIFKPSMVLPYHLYILLTQGISELNAYATAFVLLFIVLILNFFAVFLRFLKITKSGIKHE
ncbi:PstA family ABC transporter permease [uncultured Brachyspira sp.]|uniref:PstA family ABC transporter permease n=1 Tax=uncultured Brachyspira sp. TaxID=221953 RepID=UPI0025D269E0|nr:ABC transporter permease subunit [uncultured Brachyspira sp.]